MDKWKRVMSDCSEATNGNEISAKTGGSLRELRQTSLIDGNDEGHPGQPAPE